METNVEDFVHSSIIKFTLNKHKRKQIHIPVNSTNISVLNIILSLCFHVKMPMATKLVLSAPTPNCLFLPLSQCSSGARIQENLFVELALKP